MVAARRWSPTSCPCRRAPIRRVTRVGAVDGVAVKGLTRQGDYSPPRTHLGAPARRRRTAASGKDSPQSSRIGGDALSRTRRTVLALAASTVLTVLGAVVTAPAAQAAPTAPVSTGGDLCRGAQNFLTGLGININGTCPP